MTIFAVRHTKVNVEQGICYGRTNVQLADTFAEEAEKVAGKISNLKIDNVFSSPLFRCKVLANRLFEKNNIAFDDRLTELHFGDWELRFWNEIYQSEQGKQWMENYQELPCPGGESYPQMVRRVEEFLNEVKEKDIENVLVVTHAGVIRIMKSILENRPIAELFTSYRPEYGSVNRFE